MVLPRPRDRSDPVALARRRAVAGTGRAAVELFGDHQDRTRWRKPSSNSIRQPSRWSCGTTPYTKFGQFRCPSAKPKAIRSSSRSCASNVIGRDPHLDPPLSPHARELVELAGFGQRHAAAVSRPIAGWSLIEAELISASPSRKIIVAREHRSAEAFEWIASTRRYKPTIAEGDCCC